MKLQQKAETQPATGDSWSWVALIGFPLVFFLAVMTGYLVYKKETQAVEISPSQGQGEMDSKREQLGEPKPARQRQEEGPTSAD